LNPIESSETLATQENATREKEIPHSVISRNRLECLFDGIFAIAMTILVLELKAPDLVNRNSASELLHKLTSYSPTFGSYALSFLMLGMFWYRHNEQHHHCHIVTRGMLAFQLIQLALAAFFPFCAALLGRYPTNQFSGVLYLGCVFVYLWATFGNWQEARRSGALKPSVSTSEFLRIRKRVLRSCFIISMMFAILVMNMIRARSR
jgi:uncharacterized membrane protein